MEDNKIVIAVSGPTKSGKSALIAEIANLLTINQINFKHGENSQLVLDGEEAELLCNPVERGRRLGIMKSNSIEVVLVEKLTNRSAGDKINEGLQDAIAYAKGDHSRGTVHHI